MKRIERLGFVLTMAARAIVTAVLLQFVSANAQVAPFATVERVAIRAAAGPGGGPHIIATIGRAKDGSQAIIVRSFDGAKGSQLGTPLVLTNLLPPSEQMSDVLAPFIGCTGGFGGLGGFGGTCLQCLGGTVNFGGSVGGACFNCLGGFGGFGGLGGFGGYGCTFFAALDTSRRVYFFPLAIAQDGSPLLAGQPSVTGPVGPDSAGAGSSLAVIPQLIGGPEDGIIVIAVAVGTSLGEVWFTSVNSGDNRFDHPVGFAFGDGAVRALGWGLPQAGFFALGAVSGDSLFLIKPFAGGSPEVLQPSLIARLRDPRRTPLIDFSLQQPEPGIDAPPTSDPIRIVTANGTSEITVLEIPSNPVTGDALVVHSVENVGVPVKQVVFSSLTWLPADGAGVLYNRAFTMESGLAGRVWTIAGASMEFEPGAFNMRSRGRFVTATIEVENNDAELIDPSSVRLSVEGANGTLAALFHPPAELGDFDGDNNLNLRVKFSREDLAALLDHITGQEAVVRLNWLYGNGAEGSASAQIRIIR